MTFPNTKFPTPEEAIQRTIEDKLDLETNQKTSANIMFDIRPETCHGEVKSSIKVNEMKPIWKICITNMIVVGKIMCLLLDTMTQSDNFYIKTKSTTLIRIGMLILWICLILIGYHQLLAQQSATEGTVYHSSTKLYEHQRVLAISNCGFQNSKHSQCRSLVVYGVSGKSFGCVRKYVSTILCHVGQVVMVNPDANLNKTIHRVCIFAVRICQTCNSITSYNVTIVLCIIATYGDVIVYVNRLSFQYLVEIRHMMVLSNQSNSETCLSNKILFFKSVKYENVKNCLIDINRDLKYICDNPTAKNNQCNVESTATHAFCVNEMGFTTEIRSMDLSRADLQILISACRMKQAACIGIGPKVVFLSFLRSHNSIDQAPFWNNVMKLSLPSANAEQSLPVQNKMSNIQVNPDKHVVNYRYEHLGTDTNKANVKTDGTVEMPDLNDLINNLKRLYGVNVLHDEEQLKDVRVGSPKCQNGTIRNIVSCSQTEDLFEAPTQTTQKQGQPAKDKEHRGNKNEKKNFKQILKDISSVSISAPRMCIVVPVTRNENRGDEPQAGVLRKLYDIVERTLKHESVPAQESMVFELLRICTFRTFPKEGKPDVSAFAAAGFYYASKNDEVICFCCYKRISNWSKSDDPSSVHGRISPECKFNTRNSEVNYSKAVTESVQSEILAKLQGTKRSSNATNSTNTTLSMPMVQTNTIDGKRSISAGNNNESRVAVQINTSQKTHSNHALSTDSLSPTSRPMNTTSERRFQSMIPQTVIAYTASSKTSLFQTGKFVSSVNFTIPDSNTKAVQPVDDAIEPGITIDDYIDEYNSGYNGGNKTFPIPSTQTTVTGLNGIVESLITSEASVIVQGMGYSSSLLKQALSRLVNKGKTKLGPQDIMQEIFLIEDE